MVTKLVVALGVVVAFGVVPVFVAGAELSIRQWPLAVTRAVYGDGAFRLGMGAAVDSSTGLVALVVVTVVATAYAHRRLQTLRPKDD